MSKKKQKEGGTGAGRGAEQHRLYGLIAAGDYRGARSEAKRILSDAASPPEEREVAQDVLTRTDLEPGAKYVGLIALAVIAAVIALLYLR